LLRNRGVVFSILFIFTSLSNADFQYESPDQTLSPPDTSFLYEGYLYRDALDSSESVLAESDEAVYIVTYQRCMNAVAGDIPEMLEETMYSEAKDLKKHFLGLQQSNGAKAFLDGDYTVVLDNVGREIYSSAMNFQEATKRALAEHTKYDIEIARKLIATSLCFARYKSNLMALGDDGYHKRVRQFDSGFDSSYWEIEEKKRVAKSYGIHGDTVEAHDIYKSFRNKFKKKKHNERFTRQRLILAASQNQNKYVTWHLLDGINEAFECGDGYFQHQNPEQYEKFLGELSKKDRHKDKTVTRIVKSFTYGFNDTITFASFERPDLFMCFLSKYYQVKFVVESPDVLSNTNNSL